MCKRYHTIFGGADMKKSRITAIIIIACMLILQLAACKKNEQENTGTAKKSPTVSAKTTVKSATKISSAKKTTAASGTLGEVVPSNEEGDAGVEDNGEKKHEDIPEEEVFDLQGRIIRVLVDTASRMPVRSNPANARDEVITHNWAEAEQKFNCKVEYENANVISPIFYETVVLPPLLAGVFDYDFFVIHTPLGMLQMIKSNLILPVSDYLDFSDIDGWGNPNIAPTLTVKGKHYLINKRETSPSLGIWYNMDLLDREGLPQLHELSAKDQWSWQNFLDISIKATRDFDGNGIIDQWGVSYWTMTQLYQCLLLSNDAKIVEENNGVFTFTMADDPKALHAMQFLQELLYIYKVSTPTASAWWQVFRQGKAVMCTAPSWVGNSNLKSSMPGVNLGFEIFPYGPDNPDKIPMPHTSNWGYAAVNTLKDPEHTIKVIAYIEDVTNPNHVYNLTAEDSMIVSAQNQWMHTPEMLKAFFSASARSYNYFTSIGSYTSGQYSMDLANVVANAMIKIANGVAPKTVMDSIYNVAAGMCAESSIN